MNRRQLIALLGAASGTACLPRVVSAAPPPKKMPRFIPALNMATIRGHKLGFVKELETASKAGFRAVEIWMDTLQSYLQSGGTVASARSVLNNNGIEVINSIGFAEWIVDDAARRQKGVAQLEAEMALLASIGCQRVAAPPFGAVQEPALSLRAAAERYRAILELGDKTGVVPHLELWGFSKNLSRLSEVAYVAMESGHPSARVLLDVYHLYKGGSAMESLPLLGPKAVEIFHVNDRPATISAANITDADRTYPGTGVAPIRQQLQILQHASRPLYLSVEVFNKAYYNQDALTVAKTAFTQVQKVAGTV